MQLCAYMKNTAIFYQYDNFLTPCNELMYFIKSKQKGEFCANQAIFFKLIAMRLRCKKTNL